MRPSPPSARRSVIVEWILRAARPPYTLRLTLRNLVRVRGRTASSVLGIALAVALVVAAFGMLDSMNREFIKTARSKGLPEWRVNFVHGFRVALTPVIVLIGFRLPTLIGGAVIIEQVFQWPGIGNEFVAAVRAYNYPLIMMIAFFSVFAVLVASFLIDLLTAWLDPRVKFE